jgi:transcriptional regulator with XRE-family HTH domain
MSDCQSINRRVSGVRYSVKRSSGIGSQYPAGMKKSRTEYGARLYAARKHAKLTQTALAKSAGMSQSGYAEAETTGLTSTYTAQLAAACGTELPPESDQLKTALGVLTKALQKADKNTRIALEPLLASMANEPEDAAQKSQLILRLLVTSDEPDKRSHDDHATAGQTGVLIGGSAFRQLGETDGNSDRHASKGASKR